ncbi:MAG TPA: carboxypeptidase regulatory-like domain-containing protein [Thermoanaerobaculia bacterium]|nr:carboxypeptidase regulatory-like domain-containing protein [Thermoanaerobaculia bacterium]
MRGVVFDAKGSPLADARVTAERWGTPEASQTRILNGTKSPLLDEAVTNKNGVFALAAKLGGVVELRAEHEGFAPARQLVLADDENVVFDLKPAARRTGRVTANGKPVADALVIAYAENHSTASWTTRTADDGTYAIPDPKQWSSSLVYVHPDHAPFSQEDTSQLDVVLKPGATVSGTVTDSAGRPVANARVFAGRWTTATTGDDGTFSLPHVADEEKRIVAVDGAAAGNAPRNAKSVPLRLEQPRSISGTVRDAGEHPLEGMPVLAYGVSKHGASAMPFFNTAVTDAKGNYLLSPVEASEYQVVAWGVSALDFDAKPVSLRNSLSARIDLTAKKREFLTGVVVDENKRPVAGAFVQYSVPQMGLVYGFVDAEQMPSARTGGDGKFKLPYHEQFIASGMTVRLQALSRGYAVGLSEPLKRDVRTVDIALPRGIELAGIITDAAGKPVAGAGVALLQDPTGGVPMPVDSAMSSGMMQAFAESDGSGRFMVHLNAAPHDLGVWKEGFAGFRMGEVTPHQDREPLKIVLDKGVEIRGRVMSKRSADSLAGTIAARSDDMAMAYATGTVAADGTFVITGMRAGTYTLNYASEQGRSAERKTDAPVADLVLELPETGEVRGRVIDAATRQVLRSYTVTFNNEMKFVGDEETFTLHAAPATGDLTVEAEGYVEGKTRVTVEPSKPAEVTVALTRGRSARGVVRDDQGLIAGAWISIAETYENMTHSAENGEYEMTGLPREALTIEVSAKGHVKRKVEIPAGDDDAHVDIVLSRGRKVAGHVFTSDGAPVERATVTASGEDSQSAVTDAAGAYTVEGLDDGRYTVSATRDELKSDSVPLGSEIPRDLVLVMKPSAGAGRVHGVVKGFSGGTWNFGVVRTGPGDAHGMIGRNGKYVIERAPAGSLQLQAWAQSPRGEATTPAVQVTVIAGGDVEANLAFRDDIIIRGTITDSGTPAVGRKVTFRSQMMVWSTVARDGGQYELVGVEPGVLYDVEVEGGTRAYSTRHHVSGSGTFDIDIEWSRVEGRVLDAKGTPVAEAAVEVRTENQSAGSVTTDANGAFTIPVAHGSHVVSISRKGFATFTQRVDAGAAPLLVTLKQTDGLSVRLTDARDGRTLGGYAVAVDASGLQAARAADAEKDGTLFVPVADGAYRISVSANGYASQSVRVVAPHQGELRIALTPGGTLIIRTEGATSDLVKLVLPNGEEYVRCQCNGIAEIRLTGATTTVDHVAPGTYTMQVLDERGLVKTSLPIAIAEGQTTEAEIRVPE